MIRATPVEKGLKTSEMRDVSETWGERGKERKCQRGKWQRLKEKMGGKRRGMERKCESQWGWMVEEDGGRVKTRWKERKQGDEQGPHHSCFLFKFLLAALHIYLQSWMRGDWLTTTDRLILAAARLAPLPGTCAWNQVMCADVWWCDRNRPECSADISRHRHHQLVLERRRPHPCTMKASSHQTEGRKGSCKSTFDPSTQAKIQNNP